MISKTVNQQDGAHEPAGRRGTRTHGPAKDHELVGDEEVTVIRWDAERRGRDWAKRNRRAFKRDLGAPA